MEFTTQERLEEHMDILIVDSDILQTKITSFLLSEAGYQVKIARDGQECMRAIRQGQLGLVLLEAQLPQTNGFEICQHIRQFSDIPIIFLSTCSSVQERVRGLETGGDDYLIKPFEPAELLVRIGAVLRRCKETSAASHWKVQKGNFSLDELGRQVLIGEERAVRLTTIEYRLLEYLMINAGQVLSSRQILERVWGRNEANDTSLISTYMQRLRTKIEPPAAEPQHIITIRNLGYRFDPGPVERPHESWEAQYAAEAA
jgi:DNA-binding response OmpR family regulator